MSAKVGPFRYRVKTRDELLATGFALTPGGEYVHPMTHPITEKDLDYARQFSPELIRVFFESEFLPRTHSIDGRTYSTEHFVAEPIIKAVE